MSKKIKIFIIVAAVIIIGVILAGSLAGNQPSAQPSSESALSTSALPAGVRPAVSGTASTEGASDFSMLLSSVRNINIDTSIFNNPAYRSLRDYPVTLGSDTVGRPNPFAPIGSDQGVVVQNQTISSGPQVQTLQPGKITATSAEFGAQVTIDDTVPVSVVFEYGINDTFGSMTTPITLTKSDTALVTVTNLTPKTKYVVRAIVVRGSSTANGNIIPFTTL